MSHRIQLLESQQVFFAERNDVLLEAAERAGIALAHDCRLGGCATCRVRLLEGQVHYDEEPLGLAPDEAAQGYALACQARVVSDLVVSTAREDEQCAQPQRHRARVVSLRSLTPDVLHLELELPELESPLGLNYRPGQYLKLITPDGLARNFSMASAPRADLVDLHIRRIPGGAFTDRVLPTLSAGDTLEVELPLGRFFYRARDYRPILMLATGTGLAPIKAMLEGLMDDADCPPVSLYWGMRQESDLYLHHEIPGWAERLYEFRYVPVLSKASAVWQGRHGHVQHAALQDVAELGDLSEYAIYLCGSPNMIRDARQLLLANGASADHIYADSFTFQHG